MHSIEITFLLLCYILTLIIGQDANANIPAELLATALNHVRSSNQSDINTETTIQSLLGGDVHTLYKVAKDMNSSGDVMNSIQIWHNLADGDAHHIQSMVSLGFAYSEQDKKQSVKYFVQAGEDGPHQASLFNAGRMFVEMNDLAPGLAYIRKSATFGNSNDDVRRSSPKLTQQFTKAYHDLSRMAQDAAKEMGLQGISDIFMYANIDDFPKDGSKEATLWDLTLQSLQEYFEMKEQQPQQQKDMQLKLENAKEDLIELQKSKGMSDLQEVLLSKLMAHLSGMMTMMDEL